jgi:hypothetical protein
MMLLSQQIGLQVQNVLNMSRNQNANESRNIRVCKNHFDSDLILDMSGKQCRIQVWFALILS